MLHKVVSTGKTILKGAALATGLYLASPVISTIQYTTKKELIETIDCTIKTRYTHENLETTNTIELMSGMIDPCGLKSLLARYGYTDEQIAHMELRQEDEALYQAIREMQGKYGNPKISFDGDYRNYENILYAGSYVPSSSNNDTKYEVAKYNVLTNKISLHDLIHRPLSFDYLQADKGEKSDIYKYARLIDLENKNTQRVLLNSRIAELSHAMQCQHEGYIRRLVGAGKDLAVSGFDYNKTYFTSGTQENEAHYSLEPLLVQEFIETYKKYADPSSKGATRNIAKFYSGFFDKYDNQDLSNLRLKTSAVNGNPEAAFLLGKKEEKMFYAQSNISERKDSKKLKKYLDEAFERFAISAKNGSFDNAAAYQIVGLARSYDMRVDEGIYRGNNILEHTTLPRKSLTKLREDLSVLYTRQRASMEAESMEECSYALGTQ